MNWHQLAPYLVPLLVIAFFARRLIRNQPQKVRVGMLFVRPVILLLMVAAVMSASPMPGLLWLGAFALALAAGGGVGFLTTHHQEFAIDYETGTVTSRATPIGTMLILGLFAVRFGLKFVTGGGNPYGQPNLHPSADLLAWTDAGLMFSTGFVLARAATTYLRARPLLAEHKARKLAAKPQGAAPAAVPEHD